MISHNAERAGLSPLTHASMCCRATGVDPKTVRRDQPPDNPEVREEMKAIASKRRRFGHRRIGVLLERKKLGPLVGEAPAVTCAGDRTDV